jgi:hypothetical protein
MIRRGCLTVANRRLRSLTFDDLMAIVQKPSQVTFFGYYSIPSYSGQVKLSRRGPIV